MRNQGKTTNSPTTWPVIASAVSRLSSPAVTILIVSVLLLTPAAHVPCMAQSQEAMTWFFNAQLHLEDGNRDKAIECLKKALATDSSFEKARELLIELGGSDDSVSSGAGPSSSGSSGGVSGSGSGGGKSHQPSGSSRNLMSKANSLAVAGKYLDAIEAYREALKADPKYIPARANLGYCFEKTGQFKEALKEYKRILVIQPDNALVHNNLGFLFAKSSIDLDSALTHCGKAVQLEPKNSEFWDSLGYVHLRRGEIERAFENFEKALKENPKNSQARRNVALARYLSGKVSEAVKDLEAMIKAGDKDFDTFLLMAKIFVDTGQAQEATDNLNKCLAERPGDIEANFYMGFVCLSKESSDSAKYLKAVTEAKLDVAESAMAQAFLLQASPSLTEADAARIPQLFRKAAELKPNWWMPHFFLANWYVSVKSRDEAVNAAKEGIRVAPAVAKARLEALLDAAQKIEQGKVYQNDVHGFSATYPDDWEYSEDTAQFNIRQAQVVFFKRDEAMGKMALAAVIIQPNAQEFNLDQIVESKRGQLAEMTADYKEIYVKNESFPNFEGAMICYEQGGGMKIVQVFATIDKRVLAVAFIDRKETFDTLYPQFESILKTFRMNY